MRELRNPFVVLLLLNGVFYALWRGLFAPVACPEDVVVLPRETYNLLFAAAQRSVDGVGADFGCLDETCSGYLEPIKDDVPGLGDLRNFHAESLGECAQACRGLKECRSFEFSPTMRAGNPVENCQLASKSTPLAGFPYMDFKVWVKEGGACPPARSAPCPSCPATPARTALAIAPAAPAGNPECDIDSVSFTSDPRFVPQANAIVAHFAEKDAPTFHELYRAVINHDYTPETNVWKTLRNPYEGIVKANFQSFPFSNLRGEDVEAVLDALGRKPRLALEAGSFHGHSAITQGRVFKARGLNVPLLCFDPWSGDLGMLLFRDDWETKLTPGELIDGRSTSYWQFMLNIGAAIDEGIIGSETVIPAVVTAGVGAKYLLTLGVEADMVYVDSAHEADETFIELKLFWKVLRPGGVLYGDDYGWAQVKHDVDKFSQRVGVNVVFQGLTWYIKKPER